MGEEPLDGCDSLVVLRDNPETRPLLVAADRSPLDGVEVAPAVLAVPGDGRSTFEAVVPAPAARAVEGLLESAARGDDFAVLAERVLGLAAAAPFATAPFSRASSFTGRL
mmetsp:Transcript_45609/g.108538  ORF Transcript_45609/g.108538 Transcript_45609/m.108538 type:complete len:110 (-) Transcript_45609:562-891(-)